MSFGLSGVTQATVSAVLLVAMLVLYLHRFTRSRWWLAVALGICGLDQLAKVFAGPYLGGQRISLFGGAVTIAYAENREQGFGGDLSYLLLVTILCVAALFFLYDRLTHTSYRMSVVAQLGFALMVGGYLGILLDRVRLGFVRDFIELGKAGDFVYNIADLAVLSAVALLILRGVRYLSAAENRRRELLDEVLP